MAKRPSTPALEAKMLAFTRSVQVTEGLFFGAKSTDADARTPVEVIEKGVRGQSSEYSAGASEGKSNIQTVESAVLPQDHDQLELAFSARFMPFSLRPHACDTPDVAAAYERLAAGYRDARGYEVLAELYAWNIANGRFAWRNRFQSDEMTVAVTFEGREIAFDPLGIRLDAPAGKDGMLSAMAKRDESGLSALVEGIARGLSGAKEKAFCADVKWTAAMRPGQEVFPSQEYLREEVAKDKRNKGKGRIYAHLPARAGGRVIRHASMHSQKIGAALRHIDIWHGHDGGRAIAVHPYGGVQETGEVLRTSKSGKSFYRLRRDPDVVGDAAFAPGGISGDTHFVMANLVRGGVFGSAKAS